MLEKKYIFFLLITVMILCVLCMKQFVIIQDFIDQGKRFSYEDGVMLYEICQKKWWPKQSLIDRIYEEKRTDFREFILWK